MSIRIMTILSLLLTMIVLIIVLYVALCRIVSGGFAAVENAAAEKNIERVRESFASEIESLCSKTTDWATWDDAYQFTQDRNSEWVRENIAPSAMSGMGLSEILVCNQAGEILASTGYDVANDRLAAVPPAVLEKHFSRTSPLLHHAKPGEKKSGLLFTPGSEPRVFCSMPVLPTSGEGEVRGAVVFVKKFDRPAHEALMRTTKLKLAFGEEGAAGTPEAIAALLRGKPADSARYIDSGDPKTLVGYARLADFYGEKSLIARIEMPRDVLAQAKSSCRFLSLSLLVFGAAFIIVTFLVVEIPVLRRVARMNADLTRITESFDFGKRVEEGSNDEIGRLGLCVNRMLAAVYQIQHAQGAGGAGEKADGKEGGHNG
jgi:sensor domain CHASE-containing protein